MSTSRASGTARHSVIGVPMFTATAPLAGVAALEPATLRAQDQRARWPHEMPRHAAGGIAAGARGGAVGVPESQGRIGLRIVGDHGQLVEADAAVPIPHGLRERPIDFRAGRGPARTDVEHDEIVTEAVHLHERQDGG